MTGDFRVGEWLIRPKLNVISGNGRAIHVEPKVMQVLVCLAEHAGDVMPKERIIQAVWADTFVTDDVLTRAISELRRVFEDDPKESRFIQTIPKSGYRLIAQVERFDGAPLPQTISPAISTFTATRRRLRMFGLAALGVLALLVLAFALNVRGWRDRLLRQAGSRQVQSVAVLPLENLSRDPEQEYFADGMTDELITSLARSGSARVISRTSMMRYKGTRKSLAEIARELNVDAIVEGTVLRSGNRVRITAQLIEVRTDTHLWAETYERDLRDVLALQAELAAAITKETKIKLTPEQQAKLPRAPQAAPRPVNPEAYQAYLKGRYFWNRRTPADIRLSVEYYRQAIQADPSYAQALAGLADSLLWFDEKGSKAAALKAMELDETLAEPHTTLAFLKVIYEWDWEGAEREFHRALELNPNYATAHHWYSGYLGAIGRVDAAVSELRVAAALDPLSFIIKSALAEELLIAGKTDEASMQLGEVLKMDPNFSRGHSSMGHLYRQRRQYEQAIAEFRKAKETGGPPYEMDGDIGYTYALAGRRKEAESILAKLKKAEAPDAISVALIHAALGEKDQAFSWLEVAFQRHDDGLLGVKVDPAFDPLRSDPRFQALVRRMNLPQ